MDNQFIAQNMPRDEEAEKSVLGAIFLDPEAIVEASELITTDDFYRHANQVVFAAMLELNGQDKAIDVVTLTDELKRRKQLEDIGGVSYISELAEAVPTAANIVYYAKIVQRKALLRRLISASQSIISESFEEDTDVTTILDDAERKILNVSQANGQNGFKTIHQVLDTTLTQINSIPENAENITGLGTGFKALDNLTTGFHEDELIILAARPGVGKTAFALNICQAIGIKTEKTVAIFSLEMGAEQLVSRMLCSEGLIDAQHLRTGNLTDEEWRRLVVAAGSLDKTNIFIDDTPGIKMAEIRAKTRRLQKEQGDLGIVVIDYLQLIEGTRKESRQQEVSEISRQLKKLAKELHVPVIALSQLSRGVEQRQDKRPILSDIRESGSIEQDADIVAFLYRDDYYHSDDEEEQENQDTSVVEVIIEKNRSGARGTANLIFTKSHNRFSNLDYQHEPS
ncbi:replicative DNA helicase [Holzapfeliella sp. He02]|uniref:Replicative DNA helicase n=1 Tax=Holzapfeliella saturejae TaxID=3082953 RepID=A0ABU8SEV7_9LACO